MILNENYFDDLKLSDDDIQSPEDDAPSSYDKYDNPEQMFADMKSKYAHCIDIPLMHYCQRKWDLSLILKRLFYIFNAYNIEYSEPTLQEHAQQNLQKDYFRCNFINYNGYKLISNHKTPEEVDSSCNDISVVIFFNLPEVRSYKSACVFISNILRCIQNNRINDFTYGYFLVWDFEPVLYNRVFSMNSIIATSDIISIITLFFPEKSATIRQKLYADDNALLNKLLKYVCFKPHNDNWWQSFIK